MQSKPNSSKLRSKDEIGEFVTPQNTAAIPQAAVRDGDKPVTCPNRQPNVAPTNRVGTISPPLKPQDKVIAVKIIFKRNAAGSVSP